MIKPYVDDIREGDGAHVARFLRSCDRAELWAAYNIGPSKAIEYSLASSSLSWAIRLGEEAVGLFGVGANHANPDWGSPWLLATPKLEDISVTFLKQSRACVQRMLDQHSFLENWVDQRNLTSIKWLKWCGFTVFDPEPFGVEKKMFCRFEMRKDKCAHQQ